MRSARPLKRKEGGTFPMNAPGEKKQKTLGAGAAEADEACFVDSLYNATPHDILIHTKTGDGDAEADVTVVVVPSRGKENAIRLDSERQKLVGRLTCTSHATPCVVDVVTPQRFTSVLNLDKMGDRSRYSAVIVSMAVGAFLENEMNRDDEGRYAEKYLTTAEGSPRAAYAKVYGSDSGPDSAIRDERGNLRAVKRLVEYNAVL